MAVVEPVSRRSLIGLVLPRLQDRYIVIPVVVAGLVFIARSLPVHPALTAFRAEALETLPDVLAPLLIIALFIERAVEVIVSGWRASGSAARERDMKRAMEEGTADEQWRAKADLDRYVAQSTRIAFATAFVISVMISMMGVRAIEMLVVDNSVTSASLAQQKLFVRVDIIVTSLLLAGGAEGIHKVVNAFTTFIDRTTERNKARE